MAAAELNKDGPKKTFVLCFDGTGNKFTGTETDSNILKIYRLLDRSAPNQYVYYQPGIGTYSDSGKLEHTGRVARFKSWYAKAKDSAIGINFASHVMAGYRFLMRYYNPGDDIYMFGFSRGAYTARFLAEMLDWIGLLSPGNEELQRFAWKTFSKWESRNVSKNEETIKQAEFMRNFRETFSRPVNSLRFLGLFDTVNSVPRFESAWMQRTKFPYTAKSSAHVIRHAVSIDERRAKFRQDLISGKKKDEEKIAPIHRFQSDLGNLPPVQRGYHDPARVHPSEQDILEVWFPGNHSDIGGGWGNEDHPMNQGSGADAMPPLSHVPLVWMVNEAAKAGLQFNKKRMSDMMCCPDSFDEYGDKDGHHPKSFEHTLNVASTQSVLHDPLRFGGGGTVVSVISWSIMEYLPFRRMDLKPNGEWQAIRWPLPAGETRDVPGDAKVHRSAIKRMERDENYRPGNLILLGQGGRGMRIAPKELGMGRWQIHANEGDVVSEIYVKHPDHDPAKPVNGVHRVNGVNGMDEK